MRAPGSKSIAPKHLLPDVMLGEEERKSVGGFKTKEEWETHKAELARMSRFFEKVAGQVERGERQTTSVVDINELIRRHKGQ